MNTADFDIALTPQRRDQSTFTFIVPPGFGQGKATFGGLVLGGAVRAMSSSLDKPQRRLRSLQAQLVGSPEAGETTIAIRILRESKTVSTIAAELRQAGTLCVHAVGVFADTRPIDLSWQTLTMPKAPTWETVTAIPSPNPFAPEFTQQFEFRPITGLPFSQGHPATVGYIKPRLTPRLLDDAFVVAMTDAWWLAAFIGFSAPRPAATMTYTAELHQPANGLDPTVPMLHAGDSVVMSEGYSTENRTLWGHDGRLLATNRQLVTVIK
jgi:acyl-CoA thioesterase